MAQFAERYLQRLVTGAVDPDGDAITVRRIDGAVVSAWPHSVVLSAGTAVVSQDGSVLFDDGGNSGSYPQPGTRGPGGSFTFTLWDGDLESPTYTCDLELSAPLDWSAAAINFDATITSLDFD